MAPESMAPTERSMRVMVIPQVIETSFTSKSLAISVAVNDTVKKSKAEETVSMPYTTHDGELGYVPSQDQAAIPTPNMFH